MAKYKVIATFVFEDVEADSPEEAQAWVDGTSFHSYIEHPEKDDRVSPSYEVEESPQTAEAADISWEWVDSTTATRRAKLRLSAYDTTATPPSSGEEER